MFHGIRSERSAARRWSWLAFLTVALGFALGGPGGLAPARAFQAEGQPVAEGQPGDAPAPADETQRESFLMVMIRANGWIFGPVLLILSFIMVALIMMNVLQVRRDNLLPPDFVDAFEQRLQAKDYQGAYETAKNDESFVARVLAAGLGKLNRGYEEAIEGMQEVGEDENMQLEHRISYLSLIGQVAPMVGLMGTVYGMIGAFESIALSPQQPKPKDLAQDIYTALFTTLEGLAIAIPAMVAYSLLRNRVARYVLEVGMVSEGLMSRFSSLGKKPAGGAAPAAAPAARQE
ncbi:MAG: MotA/TolQ/ExbB proton channel family protein [Planctomycetales bacterium]